MTLAEGPRPRHLRYVALGDSYTIGTAVEPRDRWPDQLVARLRRRPLAFGLELVANLAVNGATSGEVLERQLPRLDVLQPEFASFLVGVNDVVRRVPPSTYEANVAAILDDLVDRVGVGRLVVVSTPDYTVTPQGAAYGDPVVRAAGIRTGNGMLRRAAGDRGIAFVDIHDLSLAAATDPSLVADDGLHPSGAQYVSWVARIEPVVAGLLSQAG